MNSKATLASIVAAVVVVAMITTVFLLNARKHEHPAATPVTQSRYIHPTYAAVGQVVTGFPRALLLGEKPQISQSYGLANSSKNEYTTSYTSADIADSVLQGYVLYFQANHYGILSKEQTSALDLVYAANKDADVSVRIAFTQGHSSVTVSYLPK